MKYFAVSVLSLLMTADGALAAPAIHPRCPDALHSLLFDRLMQAARADDIPEAQFQHDLDAFMRCEQQRG